ncbi:erythroid differentiation-related factor 1-like [Stylophora pistillata]|uniref:erythroid differentiation-related factor 1-like n=1 Tax=Stylophora pistillata TaxID=50429 RepID=UPI000C0543BF|nr:erythroid differentiation-related factor 1-like [Stylophora pistillata]
MDGNKSDKVIIPEKSVLTELQSPEGNKSKSAIGEVSSTAIVKYSAQGGLPYYNKLQQDTNLNVAPSNWLRDGRFSDLSFLKRDPVEFTSFGMAHSFVDTIGDVDVISDAENIKKLLKIPYSAKAEVSLAVHRVGPTLLLDYLDVPSLISFASEGHSDTIFRRWLYDFYCEQTGIPKDASFERKKKKKDQAKLRHIFSKFLHYSIQSDNSEGSTDSSFKTYSEASCSPLGDSCAEGDGTTYRDSDSVPGPTVFAEKGSDLFAPVIVDADSPDEPVLPQLQQDSSFQHNVLWQFEDIQMLVGSNLPIFGGGKYPAVSLRLRECGNPINVLTGLDYWLDNLMCNVPEVAMCYHLDGIVQYYDLYKTEELPNLEESNFSPKVVKDVAQNILSFMKANCTREGHTYWLFKATDSDVIKLYDLTSICQQRTDDKTENLFTVPVAMLFYRVAKNMMNQSPLSSGEQSTVRQLINNCLLLLDNETYPEIFSSASFLLSDLYSPDDVHALPAINTTDDPEGDAEENNSEASPSDEWSGESDGDTVMALKSLDVTKLSTPTTQQGDWIKVSKPLPSNVEERCKVALSQIVKGLSCVKKHLSESSSQGDVLNNTTDDSSSSESAPSPSQSPRSDAVSGSCSPQAVVPTNSKHLHLYKREKTPLVLRRPVRWQARTAGLLFHKASSVYHSLACTFNSNGKFGRGLKNCKLAFKCLEASQIFGVESENKKGDQMLISVQFVCGDSYLMLAKCQGNLAVHQEDYRFKSEEDVFISDAAEECISGQGEYSSSVKFVSDVEKNLLKSVSLYDAALQLATTDTKAELVVNLTRRLGNAKNELGVFYMNKAAALLHSSSEPSDKERELWQKSFSNFESGIRTFDATDDSANKALLLSNLGRLMRLCAQAVGGVETKLTGRRGEFTQEERGYFNKAFEFYNKALRCLAERKKSPEVWDTVTWELSGSYFSMGTLLQDFAPLSTYAQEQVEQEVTELMMKALRLCEPSVTGSTPHIKPRSVHQLYHRIASIHHRLASLYHNSYRNQAVDHSKKKARSLAELHYSKAVAYFDASRYPSEWIRIHLEQVAMCEYHVTTYGGSAAAIRSLQSALEHLCQTLKALEYLGTLNFSDGSECKPSKVDEGSEFPAVNWDEITTIVPILESRLTSVLKELVKANSTLKNKGKSSRDWGGLEMAKQMYSLALRSSSTSGVEDIVKKCQRIAETLKNLQKIKKQTQ